MHIGILQTGRAPDDLRDTLGDYPSMFERLLDGHGLTFTTWPVLDNVFPPDIDAAEGWLITGSKHGAYEDHAWIPPLEDFIRQAHAARRPMVGVCFGHQIIAQALGGKVEKFPGGWAVGRRPYDFDGKMLHLNAWHQDQVTELPEGARVLASNDFCRYAALAYGDDIFTVQPHPEYDGRVIDALIRLRGPGVVPDDRLAQARETLDTPTDAQKMARRMADFLKARAHV
ncbi:type 1 glutamine amidotransferase [Tranquillimonas alkanivorans]|uniref:GMP synthase (Glutamine-hydrolysing) n=1 Tax=Tranquillimonas alkanivorans TaxID=441119 RepID=A0A1I5KEL7_9RHOB|nr:type 1 glutamine amidotransferase [Tranquillimonas alkanivorans]SFO83438.1 GMP synthase (glutamine-hydrolysing) [Tranquillimonas alkanivorans]